MQALSLLQPVLRPFGIDLFCLGKKFLVFNLVGRNLKIKYRRSVFGIFWTLLSPIATAAVYYFVFKVVLQVQIPHYLIFILTGVLPWAFFSQTVMEGLESIVGNWGLISKVPIQLQIFPFVGALTNLITLTLALPILVAVALLTDVQLSGSLIFVFYYLACLFFLAYAVSLAAGIAFVYFRDLRHVMGIAMQVWFYATPVVYSDAMIQEKYRWILFVNPLGTIFTGLHEVMTQGKWPSADYVLAPAIWTLGIFTLTILIQKRFGRGLVERI